MNKVLYVLMYNSLGICFYFFFLRYLVVFFPLPLIPLILSSTFTNPPPRPPSTITTLLSMSMNSPSFFLFCSIPPLPQLPTPRAVSLLSTYESVSILLVSSVSSLDSTYMEKGEPFCTVVLRMQWE